MPDTLKNKPRIIIYRDLLLPYSETFIKNQVRTMQSFEPYMVGSRRVRGLDLSEEKVILLNGGSLTGRLREIRYKLSGFAPYLVKRIKEVNPSLVHVHMGKDATLFLPVHKKLPVPMLVTFHGTDATTSDEWKRRQPHITQRIYLRRRAQLINRADAFIAVSLFVKQALLGQGYPEEKIIIHYVGIDTDAFKPDPSVKREPIVLFVGRLEDFKGCQYLIEAMGHIQSKRQDLRLLIIGDGPFRGRLEKMAQETLRNYSFLGIRPHEEIKSWMNRAWVLSVPSLTEGLPTVVMESMAMGLPMALFSIPPVKEAIGDLLSDCLVPAKDTRLLADLITNLFERKELWKKINKIARERVLSQFNLKRQTGKLEEIYQKIINGYYHDQLCNSRSHNNTE